MRTDHPSPAPSGPREQGFTLLEILVVMAVIGLAYQIVMVNAAAFLPRSVLESQSAAIVSQMDYLRTECRLQGRVYSLELDLERNRIRTVFPPEDRYTSDEMEEDPEDLVTAWKPLDEEVEFTGAGTPQSGVLRSGIYRVTFDENGFTADHEVYLRMISRQDFVWTIQWNGLTGTGDVIGSVDGVEQQRQPINEAAF